MGLLEPYGRRRGARRQPRLISAATIIVHGLEQARAAIAAARDLDQPVILRSAAGAAGSAGAPYFAALIEAARAEWPDGPVEAVLDCGTEPGFVLAGLRVGLKRLRFGGAAAAFERLAEIATRYEAAVERDTDGPILDLLNHSDPLAACRNFLAGNADANKMFTRGS